MFMRLDRLPANSKFVSLPADFTLKLYHNLFAKGHLSKKM